MFDIINQFNIILLAFFKMAYNGLGLCVRAGNRSTKAGFITKVQLKNCC